MPLDPSAAVSAGAGLGGQILSAVFQGGQNKKNREFSREMWEKQNAVNDANWHRDNAYNSPANQRKLYEEAGLNPALLYESGGGFQSASAPAAPTAGSPTTKAPEFDLGSVAGAYYDASLKKAQIDNIQGATTNAAASTAADIALKSSQTGANTFDTAQKMRLSNYAAEAAEKANKLLDADIQLRTNQGHMAVDQRQKVQEEIKVIQNELKQSKEMHPQNMELLKNNIKYQQFKAMLNENGFTESDSVLWRLFGKWGGKLLDATNKDVNRTPKLNDLHPNNQYKK